MAERFVEWLTKQVDRWPTIQAFAKDVGVQDSAVHAWLHRNIVPMPGTEDRLGEVTGTPVQDIIVMMNEARKASWLERLERRRRRKPPETPPKSVYERKDLQKATTGQRLFRSTPARVAALP